jgi:hypothetical protein
MWIELESLLKSFEQLFHVLFLLAKELEPCDHGIFVAEQRN